MITFAEKETEPVDSSLRRHIKPDCHWSLLQQPRHCVPKSASCEVREIRISWSSRLLTRWLWCCDGVCVCVCVCVCERRDGLQPLSGPAG